MSLINRGLVLAVATSILFAACTKQAPITTAPSPTPTAQPTATPSQKLTISLSQQSKSGLSGTATLDDMGNGKTKVTIMLEGKTTSTPQPAHIHTGTCAKPGDVVYPLTNVVSGKSETIVDATLAMIKSKGTLINVHKSAAESKVYVACGEWTQSTTSPATTAPGIY